VQTAQSAAQTAQSVWQLNPLQRGVAIENMLGRSPELTQNFPVIDRFQNGIATSIKSIDLSAASYQNISTLTSRVTGYINTLANWQGTYWGGVQIDAAQITGREVLLAIPPGATQAQMAALQQLQQWATTVGVTLNTTVVP
jgi:filamentous hemagglutinin